MSPTVANALLAAEVVLEREWTGDDRVDPYAIAQAMDIQVEDADLPPGRLGELVVVGEKATVRVARQQEPRQKRQTCAHELGHFIRNSLFEPTRRVWVAFHSEEEKTISDAEMFADEFAGALLMPAELFRAHVDAGADDEALASTFDVPTAAVRARRRRIAAES